MGSHVWGPEFLKDHLLPQGRLTGWSPDWYAGFPAYTFYMVPPSLAILALDAGWIDITSFLGTLAAMVLVAAGAFGAIRARSLRPPLIRVGAWALCVLIPLLSISFPYNVAFKLVAVSGIVSMPAAVWVALRGLSLRSPGPELGAVASVFFLMDKTIFHIYGGNIASTMAGEFAFSISLSLSLFAIGVVARGVATGRHRALGAALRRGSSSVPHHPRLLRRRRHRVDHRDASHEADLRLGTHGGSRRVGVDPVVVRAVLRKPPLPQ